MVKLFKYLKLIEPRGITLTYLLDLLLVISVEMTERVALVLLTP